MKDSCVNNVLQAGYLDKNFLFNEKFIAQHEKVGTKIQQESQLTENSVGTLESSDLQDIPKDNDMVIFE